MQLPIRFVRHSLNVPKPNVCLDTQIVSKSQLGHSSIDVNNFGVDINKFGVNVYKFILNFQFNY